MVKIMCKASEIDDWMSMEHQWKDTDRGNLTTLRKTCPGATLSTIIPTLSLPGIDTGNRPPTNGLNHGMSIFMLFWLVIKFDV
jgi:hypothetical protein